MKYIPSVFFFLLLSVMDGFSFPAIAQKIKKDTLIASLLSQHPDLFGEVLAKKDELNMQVIYTRIDRDRKGKIKFTDHSFNLDDQHYFYPASTVKLPVAILALQKLNQLKIAGLNKNTTMITGAEGDRQTAVENDSTALNRKPSIAHYIKKILLVSDNDAFNWLYEFLGQEYINNSLHAMGYKDVQIIHRLDISRTETENRHTNPVTFYDKNGNITYSKPGERSQLVYAVRNTKLGRGFMRGDQLVNEPFDFSIKNRLPLSVLNKIIKSVMFPEAVPEKERFDLTNEDYDFLRRYMSMRPPESKWPAYDTAEFHDNYVKFLYYGASKEKAEPGIRIFNKPGDAYGFMIDAAYIADFDHKTEFILCAVIHCNSDGIFNDDKYDYETLGKPFMRNLGRVIRDYELHRPRKHPPDLSGFKFNYQE